MSWAVLAYIVADEGGSNGTVLDDAAKADLERLLIAAEEAGVKVAAQIDYEQQPGVWRYVHAVTGKRIQPGEGQWPFPTGEPLDESNASSQTVLEDFLMWAREECPADNYLVMLWGHGSGAGGLFSDGDKKSPLPVGHPLSPRQLSMALETFAASRKGTPVEILLVKACYACTVEMALELKGSVRYMIASQNLIPSQTFWPYARLFASLTRERRAISDAQFTRDIAGEMVDKLGRFYGSVGNRNGKDEVPYALLDLDRADAVVEPMRQLVQALGQRLMTLDDAARATRPGDPALIDVPTFCDSLIDSGDAVVVPAARRLKSAVVGFDSREGGHGVVVARAIDAQGQQLVVARHPASSAFQGVNLFYHPGHAVASNVRDFAKFGFYLQSKFAQQTGWHHLAYRNTAISMLAAELRRREPQLAAKREVKAYEHL